MAPAPASRGSDAGHDLDALRLALYLYHLPSAVRPARERPLPAGVTTLLEIAAGEPGAAAAAAEQLERPAEIVRIASGYFIEQILLSPDADAYQVLGAARSASDAELRRNMALLQRWVHPDLDRSGELSVFAIRVTEAWEALKTPQRRLDYESANPPRRTPARSSVNVRPRRSPRRNAPRGAGRLGLLASMMRFLVGPGR